jgi:lipoate-protein ligase A
MALDEAVLSCVQMDGTVLRFFRWAGPALTFGYSQPWEAAAGAAQSRAIPAACVVRRATGGGIVFHDGDITFSLNFPWPRLSAPGEIYAKIHRGALAGLAAVGLAAELWRGRAPLRQTACFSGPETNDLVDASGRKLLGGALRRRLGRGLYQGSLRVPPREGLEAAIQDGLSRQWGGPVSRELEPAWLEAAEGLAAKYASEAWNRRR